MNGVLKVNNWLAGLQWLFFIFTNIVVIPITVGAAFDLPSDKVITILNLSFIVTGIACMVQALIGHRRAILEGQSGLWWGVILTLIATASAQGMPLAVLGGSLTVGIMISGLLSVIIGVFGLGPLLSKLFNSTVMGVFMLLFGAQIIGIFLKGMLGIPFGDPASGQINLGVSLLSILIVALVVWIGSKAPSSIQRYSLLIGIIVGWIAYTLVFGADKSTSDAAPASIMLFPLGKPAWDIGIILTAVLTGILNTANTFGALKGTDNLYKSETTKQQYRVSFTITGIFTGIAGLLGLVPYSPYVASIGFLNQTRIIERLPFILGGFMFLLMGLIPSAGAFFSKLPLSVGSAVLFVAYLQLLRSSWQFFGQVEYSASNIYRAAIPVFVGIVIMTMPEVNFETIPSFVRPILSSGLLVGITLAMILENIFVREKVEVKEKASR